MKISLIIYHIKLHICVCIQEIKGERKKIIWMNIMRTLARAMSAARDKNYNDFLARVGKRLPTTAIEGALKIMSKSEFKLHLFLFFSFC